MLGFENQLLSVCVSLCLSLSERTGSAIGSTTVFSNTPIHNYATATLTYSVHTDPLRTLHNVAIVTPSHQHLWFAHTKWFKANSSGWRCGNGVKYRLGLNTVEAFGDRGEAALLLFSSAC